MQKVLITGATRGIGKAIAEKYKKEGFIVVGTGTSREFKFDYLDHYICSNFLDDISNLIQEVKTLNIDILINNAGINKINSFLEIDPNDFMNIQKVNVFVPFQLCQSVIPNMLEKKWGRIINISSVWGKKSKTGRASYSTSKFGIDGLTVSIANEFASKGILANCISPGFIDTDMTRINLGEKGIEQILNNVPIARLASVYEVADLAFFLGSNQNTYISGQNISIDGGFTRA